jgi:hypothetical protein
MFLDEFVRFGWKKNEGGRLLGPVKKYVAVLQK